MDAAKLHDTPLVDDQERVRRVNPLGFRTSAAFGKVGRSFDSLCRSYGLSPTSFLGGCVSRLAIATASPVEPFVELSTCDFPPPGTPT